MGRRRRCARFGTTGRERRTRFWCAASCRRPRPVTARCGCGSKPPASTRRTPIGGAVRRRWNTRGSSPTATAPGVVDQVGPGVPERWLGKRVWLYNGQRNGRWQGTAAEYIALSGDLVTELPDHVSFAEGATLGVPGMTAHRCVFVAGPVAGQDPAGDRRRRRGRPLRGAARHLGRGEGDRHGQLAGKGRARPERRRGPCHRLSARGCRGADPRHHRRRRGRSHRRSRFRRQPRRRAALVCASTAASWSTPPTATASRVCRCAT